MNDNKDPIWVSVRITKRIPAPRFSVQPGLLWMFCVDSRPDFKVAGEFELAGAVVRPGEYEVLYQGPDKREAMRRADW